MDALVEIHTAATAYVLVRKREWWDRRNLAPELDNFQFYSTQCGFCDDTPRRLLSAAVEFGLYLAFGWGLWVAIPVGYATSTRDPAYILTPLKFSPSKIHTSLSLKRHKIVNERDMQKALNELKASSKPNISNIADKYRLERITLSLRVKGKTTSRAEFLSKRH
jgi:hypothetical protein